MITVAAILLMCQAPGETKLVTTWKAVCWVESKGDPTALNKAENAVGIAQIRPVLVRDVNRILNRPIYRLEDRTDPVKSYAIFRTYCLHYQPNGGPEQWARIWNGGPKGNQKTSTLVYWAKVKKAMER